MIMPPPPSTDHTQPPPEASPLWICYNSMHISILTIITAHQLVCTCTVWVCKSPHVCFLSFFFRLFSVLITGPLYAHPAPMASHRNCMHACIYLQSVITPHRYIFFLPFIVCDLLLQVLWWWMTMTTTTSDNCHCIPVTSTTRWRHSSVTWYVPPTVTIITDDYKDTTTFVISSTPPPLPLPPLMTTMSTLTTTNNCLSCTTTIDVLKIIQHTLLALRHVTVQHLHKLFKHTITVVFYISPSVAWISTEGK